MPVVCLFARLSTDVRPEKEEEKGSSTKLGKHFWFNCFRVFASVMTGSLCKLHKHHHRVASTSTLLRLLLLLLLLSLSAETELHLHPGSSTSTPTHNANQGHRLLMYYSQQLTATLSLEPISSSLIHSDCCAWQQWQQGKVWQSRCLSLPARAHRSSFSRRKIV